MAKNKDKKAGAEQFEQYYSSFFNARWQALRQSLFLEPKYFAFQYDCDYPQYFLDSGSVLAALCLPLQEASQILDLCAAPGGKTLLLAKNMSKEAFLTSNEYSKDRFVRLKNVVAEHLPNDVQKRIRLTAFDGSTWCKFEGEKYDAILLDAPCSSERHVIQDEKYLSQWTPSRVKNLSIKQWSLLSSAFRVLKPNGYLLYSTCALNQDENDKVIERLIKKFDNAKVEQIDFSKVLKKFFETEYKDLPIPEQTEFGYHVLPDNCFGAGPLYFSLVQKLPKLADN